jgi:uncharacterized membrane protein
MNLNWFYLALLVPAIFAVTNLFDDNLMGKVYKNPWVATIFAGIFAFLPFLSLFFVHLSSVAPLFLVLCLLAGILEISSYWLYFKSLSIEMPSIVIAIWTISPAFVPFLAKALLNESLNFYQIFGFIIILTSSMVMSLLSVRKFIVSKALGLMFLASVFTALQSVIEKIVYNSVDFWTGFLYISLGMGMGAVFIIIFSKQGRKFLHNLKTYKKYIGIIFVSQIIGILAVLTLNLAISLGSVSLVKVIEGIQPIFVLLFALILYPFAPRFFREATGRGKLKKLFLMLAILLGLYLINL